MGKTESKKQQLIFIIPNESSFIRVDQRILEQDYDVHPILMNQNKGKIRYGFKNVQLFLYLLSRVFVKRVKFVAWFADYHSAVMVFAALLTAKKSVILIGGQEAMSYPELNKGVYRKKIRGAMVRFALKHTDLIIANHKSLIYHENYYYNAENPHIDGISHYVAGLKTPIEIVYNGVDTNKFIRDYSIIKQQDLILTVGTMSQLGDFYNKGYDLFIKVAARNPQLRFVLIGLSPDYLQWVEDNYHCAAMPQLTIIPYVCPQDKLITYYNKAKVFVQASISEGMPNTLSEAMLLECIPVGSNVNGIPDAIGDTGIVIKQRTVEDLENGINEALKMETSTQAKERVIQLFSFSKREKQLREIIGSF